MSILELIKILESILFAFTSDTSSHPRNYRSVASYLNYYASKTSDLPVELLKQFSLERKRNHVSRKINHKLHRFCRRMAHARCLWCNHFALSMIYQTHSISPLFPRPRAVAGAKILST